MPPSGSFLPCDTTYTLPARDSSRQRPPPAAGFFDLSPVPTGQSWFGWFEWFVRVLSGSLACPAHAPPTARRASCGGFRSQGELGLLLSGHQDRLAHRRPGLESHVRRGGLREREALPHQ